MDEGNPPGETSSFGYWVRRRRLALDLTQAALAARVGCATVTIKKIEHDQRRPSRQMAGRLAEALTIAEEERAAFIAMGLGERPVHGTPLPARPVAAPTPPAPPWLAAGREEPGAGPDFAGRDEELAALDEHLHQALAGQGRVVFVSGEAGRGKTALLNQFAALAQAAEPALIVAQGQCTAAAGLGDPYLPFRDILLALAGDLERHGQSGLLNPERARRLWAFAPRAAAIIRATGPQLAGTLVPAASLDRWLADPSAQPAAAAESERTELFAQLTAVLLALAKQRPLLLVIDDLQWVDAASVSLLFHLGRRLAGSRILLAGAFRASEVSAAAVEQTGRTLHQTVLELRRLYGDILLDLEQFDPVAARRLSDALLDREPNRLPEAFRVRLFWHTRGHPLFVVELLKEMKLRGHLAPATDGAWVEGAVADWETLPARVSAVIEQRLARLEEQDRRLLEVASVEGERFTAAAVAAITGLDEAQLLQRLNRVLGRRHGLVREAGPPQVGDQQLFHFQFSHVMFQHYLYEALGESERRLLHGRIATELERIYGSQQETVLAQLAHHYAAAGMADRALPYLLEAGDRARAVYADREAAHHYRQAVTLLRARGDRDALARTLMKLALTYQDAFDYDRAQAAFDEAFALWPSGSGPAAPAAQRPATGTPVARRPDAPHPLRLVWLDPESLDPTMGGYNLTAPVAMQLFSGLVTYGPQSEILPDVAHRWEIQDGGRRYLFHLRTDVTWSDGPPVTAHDFAFTYRRALEPATGTPVAGQLLYALKGARAFHQGGHADPGQLGIQAIDDRTLCLELEAPTSYFIHNLAYYVLLPVPRHAVVAHGPEWATPGRIVTNGPFRLAEWEPGRTMRLERNPAYHGLFSGNLDEVHLILGQPTGAQVAMYEADELDVVSNWFGSLDELDALRRRFPDDYRRRPRWATSYFFVDVSRPPFDDRRVRQALALALDRPALADIHLQGHVRAATGGFVPPGMPGHLTDGGLPYDPGQARRLLAEAGYEAGRGFPPLTLLATQAAGGLTVPLARSWEQHLGLQSSSVVAARVADMQTVRQRHHPVVAMGGWWADYPDPDNFLRVAAELSVPEWRHDPYRDLLDQASRLTDQARRLALYRQAERILSAEAPLVPLTYSPYHLMLKPWVKRYPTAAVKNPGFWKDVIIEPH